MRSYALFTEQSPCDPHYLEHRLALEVMNAAQAASSLTSAPAFTYLGLYLAPTTSSTASH